jgi:hypothetical protein
VPNINKFHIYRQKKCLPSNVDPNQGILKTLLPSNYQVNIVYDPRGAKTN